VREIVDNSSNETRTEITLDDILHSSGDMRYLQANLRRVKWRGVQAVPKDFMQEAFLQRLVEKAIRHLLGMPGQELCGEAACRKILNI
jgi:hypothetical protein